MNVFTGNETWVVPPHRAYWVPAGIEHRIEMSGPVSLRTLYLIKGLSRNLPTVCCTVNVSPLLRELILYTVRLGMLAVNVPSHLRLAGVILDLLVELPAIPLQLPMPRDSRAEMIAGILLSDPGNIHSLDQLSREAGASKRTIERLFLSQTGLTFVKWRQRARLLHALRLLASGNPVTHVALEVGYDSTSAFIAMFKKALGTTPSRYYL